MADSLHIEIARDGADLVLRLVGDFALSTATEFVRCVEELAQLSWEPRLVIDMSEVSFIDSTGTQALMVANRRCADARGCLVIRNPSGPVQRILGVTGLDQVLDLDDQ